MSEPCEMNISVQTLLDLCRAFPKGCINSHAEFMPCETVGTYFILENCTSDEDLKCKVLEWCSRDAYKSEPFYTDEANDSFHQYTLDGINKFLGTSFTEDDMEQIYTYLGNAYNHRKTVDFVRSGYDMGILACLCWRKANE